MDTNYEELKNIIEYVSNIRPYVNELLATKNETNIKAFCAVFYDQIKDNILYVALNKLSANTFVTIVSISDVNNFIKLHNEIILGLKDIFDDINGSSLMVVYLKRLAFLINKSSSNQSKKLVKCLIMLCKSINNMDKDYLMNLLTSCHFCDFLCIFCQIISRIPIDRGEICTVFDEIKHDEIIIGMDILDEYFDTFCKSIDSCCKHKQFDLFKMISNEISFCLLIQCLIFCLSKSNFFDKTFQSLATNLCNSLRYTTVGTNVICLKFASYIFQLCIKSSNQIVITKIFNTLIKNDLSAIATDSCGNFILQVTMKTTTDPQIHTYLMECLPLYFERIVELKFYGVIQSYIEMSLYLSKTYGDIEKILTKSFKLKQNLLNHLLFLNENQYFSVPMNSCFSYHGVMILIQLFQFDKNIELISNFINLDASLLLRLTINKYGSRLMQAFFDDKKIKTIKKFKLIDKIKAHYDRIVLDKNGSFVLESIWSICDERRRFEILVALLPIQNKVAQVVKSKFGLYYYSKGRKFWVKWMAQQKIQK